MRSLTVLPAPPSAQGGATDRCAVGLLLGLRAHGIDARAIAPDLSGEWPSDADGLAVERVPVRLRAGMRAKLAHLHRPLGDLARTELLAAVGAAARRADLVHLEGSLTTWLDDASSAPTVMSMHYRARLDRSDLSPWRADGRELLLFRMLERRAVRRYRWLVASSAVVASAMRRDRPGADVTVAPLSLDPDAYPAVALDGPPVAGIIGTGGWAPTADAVGRLLGRVWPAIRRGVPDAQLALAGRQMHDVARNDATAGVEVVGEVPTTQAFFRDLAVLLYPVSRGSGMKVKVVEAIASGLPVVTTTAGSEGLPSSDGVIVHDDDESLVRATIALLGDIDERRERARAARRLFLDHCAPEPATEPIVALYRRILG